MRLLKNGGWIALIVGAILVQGCGGGGSGTTEPPGSAPTPQTRSSVTQHMGAIGPVQAGNIFATFGHGVPIPIAVTTKRPVYVSQLALWMVLSVSSGSFTETFYADQALTQPAGSATYTLDIPSQTLAGTISITQGPYAGLSGTYSQTLTKDGTNGTCSFTTANGISVSFAFSVSIGLTGIPSGTGTETVTDASGYSETGNVAYNSNGSKDVTASDTNGYSSTLHFNSDNSGTGTISGPDPGLPAKVVWNSAGTGTVTFANFLVVHFTNWQVPNP